MPYGAAARLSVSGYQVCVRDASADHWFFRNVAPDLWSDRDAVMRITSSASCC
jgi:hypothetical protein